MAQKIVPNHYRIEGGGVQIAYSTSSLDGKPQLSFTKARKTLNFSGDEIRQSDTPIGALITVTVSVLPDRGFTSFSFLLPAIQLSKESAKQSFRTVGLTTNHKTTIAGPVTGVLQLYKSTELRGSASSVQFLAQRSAGA